MCKNTWRLEIAATQAKSAYADYFRNPYLAGLVCVAAVLTAKLQNWDAPIKPPSQQMKEAHFSGNLKPLLD
jgi:hypothetical protein